jgi:hypothetical protein
MKTSHGDPIVNVSDTLKGIQKGIHVDFLILSMFPPLRGKFRIGFALPSLQNPRLVCSVTDLS